MYSSSSPLNAHYVLQILNSESFIILKKTTVGSIACTSLCSLGVTNGPVVFDAVVNFAVANVSAVAGASTSAGVSAFAGVPASVVAIFVTIVVFAIPTVVFYTPSVKAVGGVPAVAGSLMNQNKNVN